VFSTLFKTLVLRTVVLSSLVLAYAWDSHTAFWILWATHVFAGVFAHFVFGAAAKSGVKATAIALGAGAAIAVAVIALGWLQVAWICLLSGLTFSRLLFADDVASFVSELSSLVYFGLALVLLVIPSLHLAPSDAEAYLDLAWISLGALFSFIIVVDGVRLLRRMPDITHRDHVSTMLFALTVGFLALLAVVVDDHTDLSFHASFATTLGGGIVIALALTLMWSPLPGWGLGNVVARHLFPSDVSLESWARRMSDLAGVSQDADQFFAAAAEDLRSGSKIERIEWSHDGREGIAGEKTTRHKLSYSSGKVDVKLYSARRLSHVESLLVYFRMEIMLFFYASKRRELRYAKEQSSFLVSETGVRLSHDIKNILHSVKAIAGLSDTAKEERLIAIVRNQLPEISRRLEDALQTIDQPEREKERSLATISALLWWGRATKRFGDIVDEFELDPAVGEEDVLRISLYDSAAENFVSNALKKREREPGISVKISLVRRGDGDVELRVADTGSPVPKALEGELFRAPVRSAKGSGVGLHNLRALAESQGHELVLLDNAYGNVVFALRAAGEGR